MEVYVDNLRFEVQEYGNKNDAPILFLHGLGSSASCLYPVHDPNHYILALNRPGVDRSDYFLPINFSQYSKCINNILLQLEINKVHLVGWSAGGMFAQAFCIAHPERVSSLTLMSSVVPFYTARKFLPLKWKFIAALNRRLPGLSKSFFRLFAIQLQYKPTRLLKSAIALLPPSDRELLYRPKNFNMLTTTSQESFGTVGLGPYFDILSLFMQEYLSIEKINVPTFIWHGTADRILPVSFAKYLHSRIKNSELYLQNNKGHFYYLENWNEIISTAAGSNVE